MFGSAWILARELVFEIERLKHAPAAPSRFDAAFVLSYRSHADQCRSASDTCALQVSPEVEIVDPTASSHRGDLAYGLACAVRVLERMFEMTRLYWSGQGIQDKETLTLSQLRVVRRLD